MGLATDKVQRLVVEAALAALAVVVAFALAAIPNVELFTFVVFLSGVLLGWRSGARVGFIAALAYGLLNPYGLPQAPLLAALVIARVLTGAMGGLARGMILRAGFRRQVVLFALAGFVATLLFDALTNLSLALTIGQTGAVMLAAVPFAIVHHVSNVVAFAVLGVSCLEVARLLPIPGLLSREER